MRKCETCLHYWNNGREEDCVLLLGRTEHTHNICGWREDVRGC